MDPETDADETPNVDSAGPAPGRRRIRLLRTGRHFAAELLVVALGVLLALWVQQWAEDRSWQAKAGNATEALRAETAGAYASSLQWRVVAPCVLAQIDRLRERVLRSGDRLEPAPVYSEPGFDFFVIRMPSRSYYQVVWRATISDGVNAHLESNMRRELDAAYTDMSLLVDLNAQNNAAIQRLLVLSRPLPLDASVRFSLLQDLDELRGRVEDMSHSSGQVIGDLIRAGMQPPAELGRSTLANSGTYRFCRTQRFPTRSLAEAERPIPN
jgi:hypothetical protein